MNAAEREQLIERGLEIHRRHPVIDTHSHFLILGHLLGKNFGKRHGRPWFWNPFRNLQDLPRLREGGVACSTFTVYVPPPPTRISAWSACGAYLDTLDRIVAANTDSMRKVDSAADLRRAFVDGRFSALTAIEGGHVIGRKLERLDALRARGLRILTLTHFFANRICDATFGPAVHGGLSDFGREAIAACERLGIVVDLSHASVQAFDQALSILNKPPMVTHTAIRAQVGTERFLVEAQVRRLAQAGGALGLVLWPWYLKRFGLLTNLDFVADEYARVADWVGAEHLMLGTDMDAFTWMPRGLRDVADLPILTAKLSERGFSDEELGLILGGNALRILEAWES